MKKSISHICLILFALALSLPLEAQEALLQVHRLEGKIIFDGIPDEEAWQEMESLPMYMHVPFSGPQPKEKTEVKLCYDQDHLYIGARILVSSPDLIQALGKRRDLNSGNCDWFGMGFDTYNDKENALLFYTNPNGLRWDATIKNDGTPAASNEPMNLSWNTFWEVKTMIREEGWYAEFRIPISSLRFQDKEGNVVMGITAFRWLPALNEGHSFPVIPYDFGDYSNFKPSLWQEAAFEGLSPRKPLYISPYLLTGFEQDFTLNSAETAYDYEKDFRVEPGLDVKYGINPNTVLDLTFNTDFAQVEADDQQFNLSRYSLVYEEKRPFFLERSSIFDFGLGGPNALFYSRRIGLYEANPVRIWGGARLNSRVGDWDLGIMDLQTASYEDLPSENFGVVRVKKRIINPYSYAGGMLTSRIGVDGSYNLAYGLDAVVRVVGDDYLTLRWAQTFADSMKNNPLSLDPARFLIAWENRKQEGFTYSVHFNYSGTAFDPGIGLEVFHDYYYSSVRLKYIWISPESSILKNHYISLSPRGGNDVVSNEFLSYSLGPAYYISFKNGWFGEAEFGFKYEKLQEDWKLTDEVIIPTGAYSFFNGELKIGTPYSRPLNANYTFEGGAYYDGVKFSHSLEPLWVAGASLELGGIYRFDHVDFVDRGQKLNNHIAGIRALYMINTKISFSSFVQYNTAIDKVISNVKFRYNPKEGTDLYVVFNEGRNTYLEREDPMLPVYSHRSLTLKFTYTFNL